MATEQPTTIDGQALRGLFEAGARCLEANVDAINALNVFPVPDGDTGINMLLTMQASLSSPDLGAQRDVAGVSRAIAHGAMLGARGNSGVILSQFLKGFAAGLNEVAAGDGAAMSRALADAASAGYQAVGKPVEGTMLSVMREAAEAVNGADEEPQFVLRTALDAAVGALARTPQQLPVLAEAGVVDAGGQGVVAILAGIVAELEGVEPELTITAPVGAAVGTIVSQEFLEHAEGEEFGYCTQFVVLGEELDPERMRIAVEALAESTVVVGDERIVRVHAHAEDPGPLLSLGAGVGTLDQINIQSMDLQHTEFRQRHTRDEETANVAMIAVAYGMGFERIFRELGAAVVVRGGQTMNPSAAELVDAAANANARHVVILPNNSNVVLTARQAAELSDRDCSVVASKSMPQGIAALLAFNPEADVEANVDSMAAALTSVMSGEVTTAVRSTSIDGVPVSEGHYIALLDDKLICASERVPDALLALVQAAEPENGTLVTLYRGEGQSADEAEADADALRAAHPGIEVEVVNGGQPHYHYLVSVE